jgi:hypothetical protein
MDASIPSGIRAAYADKQQTGDLAPAGMNGYLSTGRAGDRVTPFHFHG